MPDLLKSVKQETEIDLSLIKINAIALIGIIFSLGFAYFLSRLYQNVGGSTLNISCTLIFGTLFLVVIFLQSILIKDLSRIATVLFLQSIVLLIPFIFLLSSFILVGFITTYLLLFWGSSSGKKELQYSMKIRIFRISKFILPKVITGLSIFVAASYISVFQGTGLLISFDTFKRIALPAEAITRVIIGTEFSLDDNFADTLIKTNNKVKVAPKAIQNEFIKEQQEYFGKILQYKFEASDSLINILYSAYKQNIGQVSPSNRVLILLVLGLVLFLLVRSVGTPISWLVALVAAAIYEILIALGFAIVVLETRSREIILLK